jgi:hypothetical protein
MQCPCYGKLLCAACTVIVPEFGNVIVRILDEPERTERQGDDWGWTALGVPIVVCLVLWFLFSFWWGIGGALAVFILFAALLVKAGSSWFSKTVHIPEKARLVTETQQTAEHRCCIQCRHLVKALR